MLILLSPGHISLLDNLHDSIGSHLFSFFPRVQKERHVDVLVAVVDRIPKNASQLPPHPRYVPNDGLEGISVAYLDSDDATPDLWSYREVSTERDTMTIQQRCSISFVIRDVNLPQRWQKIQLPVANTLFLNGETSTLMAQRWVQRPYEADKGSAFQMLEEQSLPEQVINMTIASSAGYTLVHHLRTGLKSITKPRLVAASVGNIIQKVYLGDGLEASPASQELEKAIYKKIQDGEMPSHNTDVWALIAPKGIRVPHHISRWAFDSGCRLHKVLSGGGGWGVKQGLLSLDPDSHYKSLLEEIKNNSLPALQNNENNDQQLFQSIINVGDTVTFYVKRIPNGPALETESSNKDYVSSKRTGFHPQLHFGTVPSTIDATHAAVEVGTNANSASEVVLIKNFFGALSEQGMSLEVGLPWVSRLNLD